MSGPKTRILNFKKSNRNIIAIQSFTRRSWIFFSNFFGPKGGNADGSSKMDDLSKSVTSTFMPFRPSTLLFCIVQIRSIWAVHYNYYMTASLLFEDRPFCFFGPLTLGEFGPFISSEPFTFVFGLSSIMNRPFRPKAVYFDLFVQLGKVQIGISAMVERNDYSEHASRWSTRIYMGTPARYNCSKWSKRPISNFFACNQW